jgi:hypothetical protein
LRHWNSRTFQDYKVLFPGLSRTYVTFQGLEKSEKNSRTFKHFPGSMATMNMLWTEIIF